MTDLIRLRFLGLFLSLGLAFQAFSTPIETSRNANDLGPSQGDKARFSLPSAASQVVEKTNTAARKLTPVSPGKFDGSIAWVTATMLEKYHYSHQALDRSMSSRFLDRYIEALDPQHLHFLQTDLDDFEEYRQELGDLTALG